MDMRLKFGGRSGLEFKTSKSSACKWSAKPRGQTWSTGRVQLDERKAAECWECQRSDKDEPTKDQTEVESKGGIWGHGSQGGGLVNPDRCCWEIREDKDRKMSMCLSRWRSGLEQRTRSQRYVKWLLDLGTGDPWVHREETGTQDWPLWASFSQLHVGELCLL